MAKTEQVERMLGRLRWMETLLSKHIDGTAFVSMDYLLAGVRKCISDLDVPAPAKRKGAGR